MFDSVLPNYVERAIEMGAKIVNRTKGVIGTILCPSCNSEKNLRPTFEAGRIVAYQCGCGNKFSDQEAMILTFQPNK